MEVSGQLHAVASLSLYPVDEKLGRSDTWAPPGRGKVWHLPLPEFLEKIKVERQK
jgi:hypothetical protein